MSHSLRAFLDALNWPEQTRRRKVALALVVLGFGSLGVWLHVVVSDIVSSMKPAGIALRRGLTDANTVNDLFAQVVVSTLVSHIVLMCGWCAALTTVSAWDVFAARGYRVPQVTAILMILALWALPVTLFLFGQMLLEDASRETRRKLIIERIFLVYTPVAFAGAALWLGREFTQALKKPGVPPDRPIPAAPTQPLPPDPALNPGTYRAILEYCRNLGREMERHPDLYRDRDEEALRDLFLFTLSPHFQSVSAETFNRRGKTDILVRHEKANVFVAECKFWGGAKAFLATIDQTLSYLTWRDSKAAILCFNPNQQHGPVLAEIQRQAPAHPCFVKDCGPVEEGWHGYEFHLPNDPSRSVQLAVLCFHVPR